MSRGQGFKRTIMNLTDLPPEEQMKATVNAVKSAALKTPVASTVVPPKIRTGLRERKLESNKGKEYGE